MPAKRSFGKEKIRGDALLSIIFGLGTVLLMEDPEAPVTEHGLVIFKGAEYEVRAVRPSLNVLAVGLQKRTENNAEEEF